MSSSVPSARDAPRGLGRQAQQRLIAAPVWRARLEFQHLAEQGQRDDHRGGLEIHGHVAVDAERGREQAGRTVPTRCRR
jgi:hypothetical protein